MQEKQLGSRFMFHISPALEKKLRHFAEKENWKITFVIRVAIKEYLEKRA